jgi:integrative and conjugative element protein (TIGR02256 family)
MTSGQCDALNQLREIEGIDSYSLEIANVQESSSGTGYLSIEVNVHIGDIDRVPEGLPLRERERFLFRIPPDFPFDKPSLYVPHVRFEGFPHVQWRYHLCLYQADTEWNPSDGMFGFVDRLLLWIRRGALNELDPQGQAIHPPAVYITKTSDKFFIPRVDTPHFSSAYWLGLASLESHEKYIEITGWFEPGAFPSHLSNPAVAILFSNSLPWEYPTKGIDLFNECVRLGISDDQLFFLLTVSSCLVNTGEPIYFILGAPMRGVAGGVRKQHISVWMIDGPNADSIRLTCTEQNDSKQIIDVRKELGTLLIEKLKGIDIEWCRVIEDRPEIVVRRDYNSPISIFRGKAVSIWGCGALGANIAHYLCRAGVRRLVIRDNGLVKPGIVIRQPFSESDIGFMKVEKLKAHLHQIRPDMEIINYTHDIANELSKQEFDWTDDSEVLIDATASAKVQRRLEMAWNKCKRKIPIISVIIDRNANGVISVVARPESYGSSWDLFRKAKIEILRSNLIKDVANGFYPLTEDNPFQPEPGCSEPTFVGSAADSAGLSAIAMNQISYALQEADCTSCANIFVKPSAELESRSLRFSWQSDFLMTGFSLETRIALSALKEMRGWIARSRRLHGRKIETGGLIWGEWDDAMNIVWVTDASGPPPDSIASAERFICGLKGTREEHEKRLRLSRHAVGYIGMWHTHPYSEPFPSSVDFSGMLQILTEGDLPPRRNMLIILGKDQANDVIGIYAFRRTAQFRQLPTTRVEGVITRLPEGLL